LNDLTEKISFDYSLDQPTASVSVRDVSPGTNYYLEVQMLVPSSDRNVDCGAVMLKANFEDENLNKNIFSDHRIIPFQFLSLPLRYLKIVILAPFYIFNLIDETQNIKLRLFDGTRTNIPPLIFSDLEMPTVLSLSLSNQNFHVYETLVRLYGSTWFNKISKVYYDYRVLV